MLQLTRSMDGSGEHGLKHNARGYYLYKNSKNTAVRPVSLVTVCTFDSYISHHWLAMRHDQQCGICAIVHAAIVRFATPKLFCALRDLVAKAMANW